MYFFVNRLQVDPNRRIDLGTELDRKIPYMPIFALVYFSTYLFVVQPFFILTDARQFYWMLTSFRFDQRDLQPDSCDCPEQDRTCGAGDCGRAIGLDAGSVSKDLQALWKFSQHARWIVCASGRREFYGGRDQSLEASCSFGRF